jgi:hypothetical protein
MKEKKFQSFYSHTEECFILFKKYNKNCMAYIPLSLSLSITLYFPMQEINENQVTQLQPRGSYQKHTERGRWGVYWLLYPLNAQVKWPK